MSKAHGSGNPPDWATDASGAEAWALYVALRTCSYFPIVFTDCLNLLTFMNDGQAIACASHRPLARLWNLIFRMCDSMAPEDIVNRLLIWMPAHNSASSIGRALRSDGKVVTALNWRANRLVDFLARLAANEHAAPRLATSIYRQAARAAEYAAAFLGTVTYRSNHHDVEITRPNGTMGYSSCRDSAPGKRPAKASNDEDKRLRLSDATIAGETLLRGTKRGIDEVENPSTPPLQPQPPSMQLESFYSCRAPAKHSSKAGLKAHEAERETAFWHSWYESRAERPPLSAPAISGADGIAAIRQRLQTRSCT